MTELNVPSILIVDDDDMIREVLKTCFQGLKYRVLEAPNGEVASQILAANRIDLVLSDCRMPIKDGVELLEEIRRRNPTSPIVIMMTGYSDLSHQELLNRGAKHVLTKPFGPKLLIETVKKALALESA